jgi:hypothetical protein
MGYSETLGGNVFEKRVKLDSDALTEATNAAIAALSEMSPTDKGYAEALSCVERLEALRTGKSKMRVSPDTVALIIANLAGIVLILQHERAHVVVSKALGFVSKLKI